MKSKNHLFFLYTALISMLVLFTGCGGNSLVVTVNENGKTVTINSGATFIVKLDGNPTTGYTWTAKDLDTTMLEQVGDPIFDSTNPVLVGSGGTLTLKFRALKVGMTTLTLIYHRPWETGVEPLDTFSVTVNVK